MQKVEKLTVKMKRRPKMLVGKPGLDGHSNGAEQIAVRARDIGFEVVYDGIRSTPEQLVSAAIEEGVHIIGLSILSGSHIHLVKKILDLLKKNQFSEIPVVVGGIIPPIDQKKLISEIKPFDLENLIKWKVVQGGMIPKIENCVDAVQNGVRGVVILDGRKPHSVLHEIFSDTGSGTLIR